MVIYTLSFAYMTTVGNERLQVWMWVPVGADQRMPGQVYADTLDLHPAGEALAFNVYPEGTITLVPLGRGRYREQTRKEKEQIDDAVE